MAITEVIKVWAQGVVSSGGYPGIFGLTFLGTCNIPIPSEAVLPFGGILSQDGVLNVHLVAWISTAGCVAGSIVSYWMGAKLGKDWLLKNGKYMLIRTGEIEHGEQFFEKYGLGFTLWGRLIPLVRSFVSFPAGIYKADFLRFTLYAFLGSLPWCYGWTYLGFVLGKNWAKIEPYLKAVDVLVVVALVALVVKVVLSRKKSSQAEAVRSE